MKHPILDNDRNPWKYVWRCAVHGCRRPVVGGNCTRCGAFLAAIDKDPLPVTEGNE